MRLVTAAEVRSREPEVFCLAALDSPSTGIVDSHGFMLAMQGDFESAGGVVALGAPVLEAECSAAGVELQVGGDEEVRRQRHRLPGDHEEIGVVGQHDKRHAGKEHVVLQRQRAEPADGDALPARRRQQQRIGAGPRGNDRRSVQNGLSVLVLV